MIFRDERGPFPANANADRLELARALLRQALTALDQVEPQRLPVDARHALESCGNRITRLDQDLRGLVRWARTGVR